ncbi:MAG TPA: TPM domain-containing protein, partial [Phycisphaerae bacterium]|nr:TPM domain-containing protein [Phycisphaerae bacterium]
PAPLTVGDFGSLLVKSWNVERSGKGALLVVCINSRKLNISTGPAMHKDISNATCQRIIDNDITPAFKREDYEQGIRAGITSIILASQGNYHATTTDFLADHVSAIVWTFILGIIGISMFASSVRNKYGPTRDAGGSIPLWAASFILLAIVFDFLGRGSRGSSDSSSSSSSSGDSGGGGGGASGSW